MAQRDARIIAVVGATGLQGGAVTRRLLQDHWTVQSIDSCRAIWREVTGRPPRRFPMPRWLFERFAGTDETTMWRWLGANEVDFDTGPTLAIHPEALTVREWLERKQAPSVRRRQGRTSAERRYVDSC
jgi:nucleoside-diphosphate-sugar epimerase